MQRRIQEQVQRACHHAFGVVFHRDHAELGGAGRRGAKHLVKAGAGHVFDAGAEKLHGGLLAEGAGGAEVGHTLRCLERAAGRHDFAPDVGDVVPFERTGVGRLQPLDDLGLTLRPEDRRAVLAFDLADLVGQRGTLVQKRQQLLVDRVDFYAKLLKALGHG